MLSSASHQQRGAALIIGLILIMVGSIGAIAIMRGNHVHDRMASNHHNQAIAQMAAEAEAARFLEWLGEERVTPCDTQPTWREDWRSVDGLAERTGDLLPITANEVFFPPHGHAWIDTRSNANPNWTPPAPSPPYTVKVNITGAAVNNGQILAESLIELSAGYPCQHAPASGGNGGGGTGGGGSDGEECENADSPHQAFWVGMLAGGDISADGTFTGSVHANGNATLSGTLIDRTTTNTQGQTVTLQSSVTAAGTATIGTTDGRVKSSQAIIDVPSARTFIQNSVAANTAAPNARFVTLPVSRNRCVFPPTGANACRTESGVLNCDGRVFYCSGAVETSGSFRNVTIMGLAGVKHGGSSTFGTGGNDVSVAIISGGDLQFNGSNDKIGLYWAQGNMTQNGSSNLSGSMVASGNITINGQYNFRQADVFSVDIEIENWDCDNNYTQPPNNDPRSPEPLQVHGWS